MLVRYISTQGAGCTTSEFDWSKKCIGTNLRKEQLRTSGRWNVPSAEARGPGSATVRLEPRNTLLRSPPAPIQSPIGSDTVDSVTRGDHDRLRLTSGERDCGYTPRARRVLLREVRAMFSLYMRVVVLGCGLFALATQGTYALLCSL